jgi:hypothetical protein
MPTDSMTTCPRACLTESSSSALKLQQQPQQQHANTTPVGIFAFSMMVGSKTECHDHTRSGSIDESFVLLKHTCTFAGGVLQMTGILQVFLKQHLRAVVF